MNALNAEPMYFHKPKVLVCHTTKGKGVSFMENNVLWQYLNLTPELLDKALKEI
jgi:transketolase